MDLVDFNDGHYEQGECFASTSIDSDDSSAASANSDDNDPLSYNFGVEDQLKEELQKTLPECFRTDNSETVTSETPSDEASALCHFMDILNDLDEVLDKSLLACLDDGEKSLPSDDEDVICKVKDNFRETSHDSPQEEPCSSHAIEGHAFGNNALIPSQTSQTDNSLIEQRPLTRIGRSKSFSDVLSNQRNNFILPLERTNTQEVRGSMRRLDPIVLPAITAEQAACEPLTLPVILFFEHNVSMRPTSAPIQLQLTAANLSGDVNSGPLIVGRRTLLMNRALSLPSPGDSDVMHDWNGRNTARSVARSMSTSSSSSESLNVLPIANTIPSAPEERNEETEEPPFGVWPHGLSSMLACLSCTVGIFNISRFSVFSIHFGACFIIQFFILSFLIGIPLFTLHLCLGNVLESGPLDMWKISPIFQGVGISLILTQAFIGIYSIIGISWVFVYFRDAFITQEDKYKWALPFGTTFDEAESTNATYKIQETLSQYFHGEVLQKNLSAQTSYFGTIKFQAAFNLAVVWMIVFVALSKGLRSYGKAVYALIFLPICGTIVLCTKLLTMIPYDSVTNIFAQTEWTEFFINSNSWAAATQETFLTWGFLGACVMQLSSHKNIKTKTNTILRNESTCIVAFTFAILLLAAFLANTCMQVLKNYGYIYLPGSFENVKATQFLWSGSQPLPGSSASSPVRYMTHYGSLVGVTVWRSGTAAHQISGWVPLQLPMQIIPATLAVLPGDLMSPIWAIIFYFVVVTFGIAQQLAIWHCVITGIMAINQESLKVWETTITFLSCIAGLLVGLFLCTDAGVRIVHAIDYIIVGSWWHCLIQVALICAVFVVRGRPYSGEVVVAALYSGRSKATATLAALLSFTWNVILPVVLCAMCVIDFRTGQQRVLYNWRKPSGYWPIWFRQLAMVVQLGVLLLVPLTAFVQTWRYMSKGPPDILERIQNLYRPRMNGTSETSLPPANPSVGLSTTVIEAPRPPDPPPKYTPPPSYSTATGARLMNTLRRSFRTLRRITTTRPELTNETSQIPITLSETVDHERMTVPDTEPPHYSGTFNNVTLTDEIDSRQRPSASTSRGSLTATRDFLRRSFVRKSDSVKSIRSSLRRSFKYGGGFNTSNEYLVRGAEPISNTVAMSAMLDVEGSPQARSRASVI